MESKQQTIAPRENAMVDLRQRGKAFLVDFLCGLLVPSVVAQAFAGQLMSDDAPISSEIVGGLFMLLFFITYWIVVPYASGGQTIGKRIFGLRIVSCTSERLSLRQLAVRTLCYAVTAIKVAQMRSIDSETSELLPHDVRARTQVVPS
jgi:uncharacterized RDD family membrane protein YckC